MNQGMGATISLRPLKQSEFEAYMGWALPHLAKELEDARDLTEEEALSAAKRSFEGLFPHRQVDSNDHRVGQQTTLAAGVA